MNKTTIILISILAVLITFISWKYYFSQKENFQNTYKFSYVLLKKAKEINILQKEYKNKIPYFCKKTNGENIKFICKNMDKNRFLIFQNDLLNSFINKFDIEKNGSKTDAWAEYLR
jgi:flagellar biosynthesis/type III secretory pathway M-ring protein FliF/YscJ